MRWGRQARQGEQWEEFGEEGLKPPLTLFVTSYDNGSAKGRKRFWKRQPKRCLCIKDALLAQRPACVCVLYESEF